MSLSFIWLIGGMLPSLIVSHGASGVREMLEILMDVKNPF